MSVKKESVSVGTIGSIGCGNMGGAILKGLATHSNYKLMGSDPYVACLSALQPCGVKSATDTTHLVTSADIIILAVKPAFVDAVVSKMLPSITKDKIIISVVAGLSVQKLQEIFQKKCPVVRCMPTLTAGIGKGVFAFNFDDAQLSKKKKDLIFKIFQKIGTCIELEERLFTAFSALIGAGPAYIFHLVNSFVQAGVTMGFPRQDAKRMVGALCTGSLQMAMETKENLLELRDQVCSPGGITIEAINHMERMGVNGHIVDAILTANDKALEMEKE